MKLIFFYEIFLRFVETYFYVNENLRDLCSYIFKNRIVYRKSYYSAFEHQYVIRVSYVSIIILLNETHKVSFLLYPPPQSCSELIKESEKENSNCYLKLLLNYDLICILHPTQNSQQHMQS